MSDIELVIAAEGKSARSGSLSSELLPVTQQSWWEQHVEYSKFNRQGLDIFTASFVRADAKANVVFVTGWSECFLKYADLIRKLFDAGFNVYTYDHQSQGLSGRWLAEHQSTWVGHFEDYVDDFVYFVTHLQRGEDGRRPFYSIAHSMGGLITAQAMVKHPQLINKAAFSAPMFRNKCAMKALRYRGPLPVPLAWWIISFACFLGLGKMHALGFFIEDPNDPINLELTTDKEQLGNWERLRRRYPRIISSCVTNNWSMEVLKATEAFSQQYSQMKTPSIVFKATEDIFVYNHAMDLFAEQALSAKCFTVPDSYHEVLLEKKVCRDAVMDTIIDFFSDADSSVKDLVPKAPVFDSEPSPALTLTQLVFKSCGVVTAIGLGTIGVYMIIYGKKKQ